ncbi:MAG: enoyl-CoA hydratase/isomerase family protein [Gammaproteobacteria bacterium]|uniref:enoyl-CoA hydratase/isomerase family protein n=1 Tax=Pseudomaricurvus alcaniphilus TaxID=1166482 RepID=UPI0014072D9E|nr:enoyl-CoA hydratase-related protein [Pseudomaricurvus alcaniphilus]MBR9910850.1 enoyl-CoA hydratase/isomerase family protein [Gammaproteobacteria bacterium]NHN37272.1 enoyl-CoA hydratase/isomerase family protein [Pseudomaricurvus alcaniphilus]
MNDTFSSTSPIGVRKQGAITHIELSNPKRRNALSGEMTSLLADALRAAHADENCRAIVLSGAGEHFCAGGDVSAMQKDRPILGSRQRIEHAHHIVRLLAAGPKPVVCAIEGVAFGLGMSLALACDVVVAAAGSSLCAVFNKVGLVPDMGLMWTLAQRVGVAKAKQLFFSAEVLDLSSAEALALVDHSCAKGEAVAVAFERAEAFCSAAPMPVALIKAAYAKGFGSLEDALRAEVDYQPALYLSEDHQEGVKAFFDKRKPVFKGK